MAFYVINYAPGGSKIHAWFQRRVTGRFFPAFTQYYIEGYLFNIRNFKELEPNAPLCALEFGAGANLLTPLLLSAAGADKVFVYDVKRLATIEQVNNAIRQLHYRGSVNFKVRFFSGIPMQFGNGSAPQITIKIGCGIRITWTSSRTLAIDL